MSAIKSVVNILGNSVYKDFKNLDENTLNRIATVLQRPDLGIRHSHTSKTIGITTAYGSVVLDATNPTTIRNVYVNGQGYTVRPDIDGMDAIEMLVGDVDSVTAALGTMHGRRSLGRQMRSGRGSSRLREDIPLEVVQQTAYDDLSRAGLTYDNIFRELSGVMQGLPIDVSDVVTDLYAHDVDESDIARFLIYDSAYQKEIMSRMYNYSIETEAPTYNYETVRASDDSFVGRLTGALGHSEALYDVEKGILTVDEGNGKTRSITNLPNVDERGVFHNGDVHYLPYYIGYFAEGAGSRVERLRVIDPVEQALNGVQLQYNLTGSGDVKFKTLLDVSRNLPDFENHPYGDEILDTMKKKVVLSNRYRESNSLVAEYNNTSDELGAVALTMLDDDAKGIIDPLGTSNGRNLGMIFYLTKDATINEDGSITAGQSEYSSVGEVMSNYEVDKDNFNRNQMSFNAFLTSLDVQKRNVFVGEFGLWNSEDAIVLMNDLGEGYKTGDKMEDFHGNKSVISVVVSDLSPEEIAERKLENAVAFAKANPHVDIVTSPSSLASRLNMGIIYEGLSGNKQDVTLPNGSVVKDGCVELMYMRLPQTAEHKSKDYAIEGGGRRYSTLLRYALSAKVGDLYKEGLVSDEVRNEHIDEAVATFGRLGVTFKDESKLISEGNVNLYADAPVTIHMDEFQHVSPAAIRMSLMRQMDGANAINIDLGEVELESRLYAGAIKDSLGRNVLPIRIPEDSTIPYRYMDVLTQISRGNYDGIKTSYARVSDTDYRQLTTKDNILKNIDTMTFKDGAKTTVIVPDPSVGIGEVRSNSTDNRLIIHRDPAIQSGNALSVINVGGAAPNVLHVNPLMINMPQGDFDGDTMGENDYSNINLSEDKKQEFFNKSSVAEHSNYYGEVNLSTGGSHFRALANANGIDTSDITFEDGKSRADLINLVESKTDIMLRSPNSYGAYAISFENEQTAKETLCALADDGVKGKRADIEKCLNEGYSNEDNRVLAKALIAKSEWTGMAGAITNSLIANLGDDNHELSRSAMDVTQSMTQAVLQMKKDAERLPEIDGRIKEMKNVMNGKYDTTTSRQILHTITSGLIPSGAVDTFVNSVIDKQETSQKSFGDGVINNKEMTTTKLSYISAQSFEKAIQKLGEEVHQNEDLSNT